MLRTRALAVVGVLVAGLTSAASLAPASGAISVLESSRVVGASFDGITCTSVRDCVAVGSTQTRTLAEQWNGRKWAVQRTPDPAGEQGDLQTVSCPSARDCMATGDAHVTGSLARYVVLAERWNGRRWSIVPASNPAKGVQSELVAAACLSADWCIAVGDYTTRGSGDFAVAERWNGRRWAMMQRVVNPPGGGNALVDVRCLTARDCVAVGYDAAGVLVERWNGRLWAVQNAPDPDPFSGLSGIYCRSGTECMTVGYHGDPDLTFPLAERWSGRRWTTQLPPYPNASSDAALSDVSCPSATICLAVGGSNNQFNTFFTLAERWRGGKWATVRTPNAPGRGRESALYALWCASARWCLAVGSSDRGTERSLLTLTERWNGARWTIVPSP